MKKLTRHKIGPTNSAIFWNSLLLLILIGIGIYDYVYDYMFIIIPMIILNIIACGVIFGASDTFIPFMSTEKEQKNNLWLYITQILWALFIVFFVIVGIEWIWDNTIKKFNKYLDNYGR